MALEKFIEDKLNQYAKTIIDKSTKSDEHALGELTFYMSLRRVTTGKATPQDIGMMDAINDTLQEKGIIDEKSTFLK
ncbi:hypothetical protein Xen7305DRAFT_00042120 [Xenococcus sp. PCC 7305]|uniref:hypothetical protein n=1 Tax=Xenococcus sp. PCC 7305 TaxID=102125 RepID=UPI0002ABC684|nr:hypothetical protein [Xenococcus sp. PCC 7305]ELS04478.1 hypothetical protein Xen7305DRAFT_00042120 [Xenococcus sp. PCC 7305]